MLILFYFLHNISVYAQVFFLFRSFSMFLFIFYTFWGGVFSVRVKASKEKIYLYIQETNENIRIFRKKNF